VDGTLLYNFAPSRTLPWYPACGVIFDASGNLYGTTQAGGEIGAYGTVFELMPGANGDLRPGRKFVRDNQ